MGFSLSFRATEGWREVDRGAVSAPLYDGCGQSLLETTVWSCNVGWWGSNLAVALSLLEHNGTMNPQRPHHHHPVPSGYYHKKRAAEPI